MKIDLTTPESALAYLGSLPPSTVISLPSGGEMTTAAADAVSAISGIHASEWARGWGKWEWTSAELEAALRGEYDAARGLPPTP